MDHLVRMQLHVRHQIFDLIRVLDLLASVVSGLLSFISSYWHFTFLSIKGTLSLSKMATRHER